MKPFVCMLCVSFLSRGLYHAGKGGTGGGGGGGHVGYVENYLGCR